MLKDAIATIDEQVEQASQEYADISRRMYAVPRAHPSQSQLTGELDAARVTLMELQNQRAALVTVKMRSRQIAANLIDDAMRITEPKPDPNPGTTHQHLVDAFRDDYDEWKRDAFRDDDPDPERERRELEAIEALTHHATMRNLEA